MVRPAVTPSAQEVPLRVPSAPPARGPCSCRLASTKRYGFSRLTGVVASVVYGGSGKVRRRAPDDAGEHLVPHAVGPAADLAVAGQPLLLRAVDDDRQAASRR